MKKLGLLCLTLCLFVTCSLFAAPVSAEETSNRTVADGAHSVDGQMPLLGTDRLVSNVQSAIIYEMRSETLMHAFNADEQTHPASMVKILTALMVIERADLSEAVTVTQSALDTVAADALSADLVADEVMTVEDLLYCMMVGSANDAAAVLAEHVSGSQSDFVAEMNLYAQSLGCTSTNFTNAHGLHDDQQYTTVRDMTRILAKAMENEAFCKVFGSVYYTVPATNMSEERSLSTGNYLMNNDSVQIYYDSRVTGGRTGVTSTGYRCIATTAEGNGMQLICIITGSESVIGNDGYSVQTFGGYNETSMLLNAGFEGFTAKQVVYEGQIIQQLPVENGTSDVVVGAAESVYTVLPSGVSMGDLSYRHTNISDTVNAPVEKGQVLSNLEVWYEDICVAQIDLCAMSAVPVAQTQTVNTEQKTPGSSWSTVLTAVICTIVGMAVIFLIIRGVGKMRKVQERNRSRRNRRNRRRSR